MPSATPVDIMEASRLRSNVQPAYARKQLPRASHDSSRAQTKYARCDVLGGVLRTRVEVQPVGVWSFRIGIWQSTSGFDQRGEAPARET